MPPMQVCHRYGKGELRVPAQQRPEGELTLHSSQRSAETVVDAVTEGEMTGFASVEVEVLGAGVSVRVSVRRRQADDDLCAGGNRRATEIQGRSRVAERRVRDGCVEAEELLHGPWDLGGVGAKLASWSGLRNRATRLLPMRLAVVS